MTHVNFFDDTCEILVWNAVDLIIDTKSPQQFFYDSLLEDKYRDLVDAINEMVVIMPIEDQKEGESMLKNYKRLTKQHIQSWLRKHLLSKVQLQDNKIIVPLKLYVVLLIEWYMKIHLDTLWYFATLNPITAKLDSTAEHNKTLQKYSQLFTSIICRASYETHYFFNEKVYSLLKGMFNSIQNSAKATGPFKWESFLLRELLTGIEATQNKQRYESTNYPPTLLENLSVGCEIVKERREWQHYTLDYIIFSTLFLNAPPLIIISKDCWNIEVWIGYELLLTNDSSLNKMFIEHWVNFLLINPFRWLLDTIQQFSNEESKNILQKWKEKYAEIWNTTAPLEEKMSKLISYITKQLHTHEKIEFAITTKFQEPDSITSIITQSDPKKFHSTQMSFDHPPEVKIKPLPWWKERRIYTGKKNLKDI